MASDRDRNDPQHHRGHARSLAEARMDAKAFPSAVVPGRVVSFALLRRLRAVGLRAPPPGGSARAGPDRCALARQVPRQRPRGEHARVRARVLVQGRSAHGPREPLPRLVMTDSVAEGAAAAPDPGLSPLILACLAATWLIWGSTYLA